MNVLIIKQGALGDIIMAIPIIRQIQAYHHGDSLHLLTTPAFADLFRSWRDLHVTALPRRGIRATLRTIRWLRQSNFHRLYDLQSNDRSSILCALSGISERVGNHARFPYHYHPPEKHHGQCHAYERLNQVLASVGIDPSPDPPTLHVGREEEHRVWQWLDDHQLKDQRFILIHAGSSLQHPAKRWPHYADLARVLTQHEYKIIWIGGDDDRAVNRVLSADLGIDASGAFSVRELVALGKYASFAITNDSAPMHILSCSGISVYGLFGPTNWRRVYAVGQRDRVISLDQGDKRRENDIDCFNLSNLSVAIVLKKLQDDGLI